MRRPSRLLVLCCALVTGAACAPTARPGQERQEAPPAPRDSPAQVNPHAKAMASFQEAVGQYMALQKKLKGDLPRLPAEATPEQMHAHQLALAARIRDARRTAKPGDLFNPDLRIVIRTLMAQVFGGPEGKALRADIMDENPGRIKVAVNDRYPDHVPLSMVPPQVLAGLPKLPPKEVEYRFLGRALILLDTEAHLIVDIMENAIP